MKVSTIGWTDYSSGNLNFASGCTPAGPGCKNCYAAAIYERFNCEARFGRPFSEVTWHQDKLDRLLTQRFPEYSPKRGAPHRPMCFVCDTGDLFHEDMSDSRIAQAFALMQDRQNVVWQVLTKRAQRMHDLWNSREFYWWLGVHNDKLGGRPTVWPTDNIWLGVSVCDQATADERIPLLLNTPAAVRFVSVEPMLAPVDLTYCKHRVPPYCTHCSGHEHLCHGWLDGINQVICGAESGPNRRPFKREWAEGLWSQCREAGVAFYGKQDSGARPGVPLVLRTGDVVHEWPEGAR